MLLVEQIKMWIWHSKISIENINIKLISSIEAYLTSVPLAQRTRIRYLTN